MYGYTINIENSHTPLIERSEYAGPKYHLFMHALEDARLRSYRNTFGVLPNVSTSTHERKLKNLKSNDEPTRSR